MVERCIERANARAAVVARAMGVRILGVHSHSERHDVPPNTDAELDGVQAVARRRSLASAGPVSHGPVSSSARVGVVIAVQYRVGDYQPPAHPMVTGE